MKEQAFYGWIFAILVLGMAMPPTAQAASGAEINVRIEETLNLLKKNVEGAEDVLAKAKGILVLPSIWKGGIGWGGEYGEGALLKNGIVADYYSVVGLSFGLQLGLQNQELVVAFLDETVMDEFHHADGWEFGLDASAVFINAGVDGRLNSYVSNAPVVVFVIDQQGLMANLSIEGYKFTKIKK